MNIFAEIIVRLKAKLIYKFIFKHFGKKSLIFKPMLISNAKFIDIGHNVCIRQGGRLEVVLREKAALLKIGNNVNIEQNVHITCVRKVTIDDNVGISGNVTITDIQHALDPSVQDKNNIIKYIGETYIGRNTIVFPNVVIYPGVKVGKFCILCPNSVVVSNIDNFSMIAGNPAKVIKKYDFEKSEWVKV